MIIPAHDEEAVIGRCLSLLLADAEPGEFDVVVACNACTDRTAEIAADFAGVRVIEIDEASKFAALDAGDAASDVFPRLYLDADIRVGTAAARAVASALRCPDVMAAAPRVRFDATGRPWTVRQYFALFQQLPAFGPGYVGSGLYALSATGRSRFDAWPRGLPDDGFVQRLIPPAHRATTDGSFTVTAPGTLHDQTRRMVRVQGLNRALECDAARPLGPSTRASTSRFLFRAARSPRNWPGIVLLLGVNGVSRLRALRAFRDGNTPGWMRDDSVRLPG